MKTVGELRHYLEINKLSPEQIATTLGISNMTIRRLLKKSNQDSIPAKYAPHFAKFLVAPDGGGFNLIFSDLERSGESLGNSDHLKGQYQERLKDERIDELFLSRLKIVAKHAFSTKNMKYTALCLGALAYFVNPLDMIPDLIGPMGLVDDFGVVSLVCAFIAREK